MATYKDQVADRTSDNDHPQRRRKLTILDLGSDKSSSSSEFSEVGVDYEKKLAAYRKKFGERTSDSEDNRAETRKKIRLLEISSESMDSSSDVTSDVCEVGGGQGMKGMVADPARCKTSATRKQYESGMQTEQPLDKDETGSASQATEEDQMSSSSIVESKQEICKSELGVPLMASTPMIQTPIMEMAGVSSSSTDCKSTKWYTCKQTASVKKTLPDGNNSKEAVAGSSDNEQKLVDKDSDVTQTPPELVSEVNARRVLRFSETPSPAPAIHTVNIRRLRSGRVIIKQ